MPTCLTGPGDFVVDLIPGSGYFTRIFSRIVGPRGHVVFNALQTGGVFIIVDHVAEAGSGMRDTDTLHRIDPQIVKDQVTAAGFKFDAENQVLRNSADDHSKKVFDESIRGHTDQFAFRFRKS